MNSLIPYRSPYEPFPFFYLEIDRPTGRPFLSNRCCRCGKNYGWSHYEGSRCQSDVQERNGLCKDLDRSKFTFPIFEYCHPDYYSDADGEEEFVGGVNVCGDRLITGHSVIGKFFASGLCLVVLHALH